MQKIIFLLVCTYLSFSLFSQAVFSSNGGNWSSSASWTLVSGADADGIPDADDDVEIINNSINLNINSACNLLSIGNDGVLNFNTNSRTLSLGNNLNLADNALISGNNNSRVLDVSGNLIVSALSNSTISGINLNINGTTNIDGDFSLTNNTGVKTFSGLVAISGSGSWTSTSITSSGNLIFQNGIENNSNSFLASGASFESNNQQLSGSTEFFFSGILTVDLIELTNNSIVNHTNAGSNTLTGTGTWIQGLNSTLNTTTRSMNISNIDASSNINLVNYNRNNTQTVYPTSYSNLIISVANTKTLGGNTSVINNLEINIATLATSTFTLDVTGLTTINSNGNLNTTNAAGVCNLQDLILNSSRLIGSATGTINLNTLTTNDDSNNIGRGNVNIADITTINGETTFSNNNGGKTFIGKITISPSGSWTSSVITTNGNLIFQNGIENNGVSFSASAATFNLNNQQLSGSTAYLFSGILTVELIELTNNSIVNHTNAGLNSLTGTGTWTQGLNSTLNTTTRSMNISNIDASSNINLVNYNRNNTQTVYPTSYSNLMISVANTKTLGGNTSVINNLEINIATLATSTFTLDVTGLTTINSNGNLNTTNAAGVCNLQDLILNSSRLIGSATGTINLNTLTTNDDSNNIGRGNVNIADVTTINGETTFSNNNGVKTYSGKVTISPIGSWTSTAVTTNTNMLFLDGISNNGMSFSGGAARFITNNQELNGTTEYSFSSILAIIGVDLTNNSIVTQTSTSSNAITGSGTWIQAVNSVLNTQAASINISAINATATPNLFNYNRNGSQTVFVTSYHNLEASVGGNKTLGGNISVANDLNIDVAALLTNNRTLTVNGITTVSNAGNLNTSNSAGIANLQSLILNSGSISGNANGIVNASTFVSNGLDNIVGTCRLTISGASSFNGSTTFNSATGNKTFSGSIEITSNGEFINSGGIIISGANSWTNDGLYRSISGTTNIGTLINNSILNQTGSTFEIQGGTVNIAGFLSCDAANFEQSGGTINLTTVGNNSVNTANLDISSNSNVLISSGNIILRHPNTNASPFNSVQILAGSGSKSIIGGTIQLGDASTGAAQTFLLNSAVPFFNFTINNINLPKVKLVDNPLQVAGVLSMNGGNIDGASNSLDVKISNPASNAISRTNGFVNFNLQRAIGNTAVAYSFPVGFSTNYQEASFTFTDLSAGDLTVQAISGDEANLASSAINSSENVNAYWNLSATGGLTSSDYDAVLNFQSSQNDDLSKIPNYIIGKFENSWTYPTISGTINATSAAFEEGNGFGDIVIGAIKNAEIIVEQCNLVLGNDDIDIYCNEIPPANIYEFRLVNGSTTLTIQKPSRTFKFSQVAGVIPATIYDVSVRTSVNGIWSNFGNACPITSSITTAQIVASQCATVLGNNDTDIYCNSIASTTIYEFQLINGATTLTIQKPSRTFKFSQVNGILPGTAYSISVRTFTNGSWTAFGAPCTITSASQLSKIVNSQCGITLLDISTDLYADNIIGATTYRFRVSNSGGTLTIDKASRTFKLTQLANAKYDEVNVIDVDVFVNGAWIGFGATCNVTTPTLPTTKLMDFQCGITLGSTQDYIYADPIFGATQYRFRIENTLLSYSQTKDKTGRFFRMVELTGLEINTTYDVDVDFFIDGSWQGFGTICTLTTPAILAMPKISDENIENIIQVLEVENDIAEIQDQEKQKEIFLVYPNPFNQHFLISSSNQDKVVEIQIIDGTGKIIEQLKLNGEEINKLRLGENLKNGIYYLNILSNSHNEIIKIIKD